MANTINFDESQAIVGIGDGNGYGNGNGYGY
jgi:hypothetical protein